LVTFSFFFADKPFSLWRRFKGMLLYSHAFSLMHLVTRSEPMSYAISRNPRPKITVRLTIRHNGNGKIAVRIRIRGAAS